MRIFSAEQVEAAFKELGEGVLGINHEELTQGFFRSYDDFDRFMTNIRGPIWIDALVELSGCARRGNLEEQWGKFGEVFRRFHGDHLEWLEDPGSCPEEISEAREAALDEVVSSFTDNKKCHWKRDHAFVCFCS